MHIHFLHNSSEGMFLCLPEELYILSAFFVRHVHSAYHFHFILTCIYIYIFFLQDDRCCQEYPILFNNVDIAEMYTLEYAVYHLRPFGIGNYTCPSSILGLR